MMNEGELLGTSFIRFLYFTVVSFMVLLLWELNCVVFALTNLDFVVLMCTTG